jgi:hypothetical protein
VNSSCKWSDADVPQTACVLRRFRDFTALRTALESTLPGLLIPALPEKAIMGRFDPAFVEERRRALQLFLQRCLQHEYISRHLMLKLFLTATDADLQTALNQPPEAGSLQSAPASLLSSWFDRAASVVTAPFSSATVPAPSDDDLSCDRMMKSTRKRQDELTSLEAAISNWLGAEKTMGRSWGDLSTAASIMARTEGANRGESVAAASLPSVAAGASSSPAASPPAAAAEPAAAESKEASGGDSPPPLQFASDAAPANSADVQSLDAQLGLLGDPELQRLLSQLGTRSYSIGSLISQKEQEAQLDFREPIKDAIRTAEAVIELLKKRQALLEEYHTVLAAFNKADAATVTARNTVGKESSLPRLSQASGTAQAAAETKRIELAQTTDAIKMEYARNQRESKAALKQVLATFVQRQVHHHRELATQWEDMQRALAEVK